MPLIGLVTKAHSGFFTVNLDDGEGTLICSAAGRLTKRKHESDALAIGDRVTVERVTSEGLVTGRIMAVHERAGVLSRLDPIANWSELEIRQVIVANVDLCVFVFACASPDFHPRMLDRYLVGAESQKLASVIVASKVDLVGLDHARALFADYERMGYDVIYASTKQGAEMGIEELRATLHGKLSVLTGKSGAGKSTLLNALRPGLALQVGTLSKMLNKGRHTTVVPELFAIDARSWLADTPGLRAYSVWDVGPEELDGYYRELAPLVPRCEFSDCTHRHEPGCAVLAAVRRGEVSAARYDSYVRLREELEHKRKW